MLIQRNSCMFGEVKLLDRCSLTQNPVKNKKVLKILLLAKVTHPFLIHLPGFLAYVTTLVMWLC